MSEEVLFFASRKSGRQNQFHKMIKRGERVTKKSFVPFTPQAPKENMHESQPNRLLVPPKGLPTNKESKVSEMLLQHVKDHPKTRSKRTVQKQMD